MSSSAGGGQRRWRRLVAVGLGVLASGCAPATVQRPAPARLLQEARDEGLPLADPLAIDDGMKAAIDEAVSRSSRPEERLRVLRDFVRNRIDFRYATSRSLTAREAWRERSGDCMAYSNLVVALGRHVGLKTYFVYVREVRDFYERDGGFFVSSHVAVGHGSGPNAQIIDLSKELSRWNSMADWKLAAYRTISDGEALALYFNNVAVDRMLAGDVGGAERLFRFWLQRAPGVAELHNNLGVLLNRQGRHQSALALIERAIGAFPSFKPLYTNGLLAARGAGRADIAADLARRGEALEHDDPFFTFARALKLYHEDAFEDAARELERARSVKPDSPVILAWLTRAYMLSGKREQGLETFERAQQLSPRAQVVRELAAEFPELR